MDEFGQRVEPADLFPYRLIHKFRGPSCLCAMDGYGPRAYTEAAIFVATMGQFVGEYIAACARDRCGYLSK
jgi:hypothetical protein